MSTSIQNPSRTAFDVVIEEQVSWHWRTMAPDESAAWKIAEVRLEAEGLTGAERLGSEARVDAVAVADWQDNEERSS